MGEIPLARKQRRLAAILAADMVDCSRPMGRDAVSTTIVFRIGLHLGDLIVDKAS
jgi:hypothetical protein